MPIATSEGSDKGPLAKSSSTWLTTRRGVALKTVITVLPREVPAEGEARPGRRDRGCQSSFDPTVG